MFKRVLPFILLMSSNILFAQILHEDFLNAPSQSSVATILKDDISNFVNVSMDFIQSPLHFDSDDLLLAGIITGATTLSFSLDNPIRNGVKTTRGNFMDKITPYGEKMGNPAYSTALSGILYAGGFIIGDKQLRETGQILFQALLFNGIVTQGMKLTFGRSRPFTNEGSMRMEFMEFENENAEMSLPSGHTSTAFTAATVLSQRMNNIYFSIAIYSLAGLTAYQRIYSDVHWFSDTLLGAAVGTLIGLKVVKLYETRNRDKDHSHLISITPQVNSMGYGMNLSFVF